MPKMIRTAFALIALLLTAAPAGATFMVDPYAENCANFTNLLPRIVRKETVAAVDDDYSVSVRPFCRGVQFNDLGNAAGLTRTIANNDTLADALAERGWRPDDVMFIVITGDRVDLWVHRN